MKNMLNLKMYDKGISLLLNIFPQLNIDSEVYYHFLKDIPDNAFLKAINLIVREVRDIYPNTNMIALIREYAEGNSQDKALIAWNLAKTTIKDIGYCKSPEFKDPIISQCINQLGGWMMFCSVTAKELPFMEKRFMDLYKIFLKREIDQPKKLTGFIESSNRLNGYLENIPNNIRIGFNDDEPKRITE